jgi:hypothetical protein
VDEHRWERRPERRVHLSEAAEIMGVSKDAVRMRVKRGTLRSEKGTDGRVYVWVNVNPDGDPNAVHPQGEVHPYRELIEELRDRVRSLEDANRENRRIIAALTQRIPALEAPEPPEPREEPETHPVRPKRAEPAEPVDPQREEPERVEPERVEPEEPERPEPRESPESPGPTETTTQGTGGQEAATERPWWRRMFSG